ncbi:MAG TPA: MBL fold metallo-hydrolase [Actinomycetota bacterium]
MDAGLSVARPWFRVEDAGDGVTRLWEHAIDDLLESNVWHVRGRDADLVVDTANGVGALAPAIEPLAGGRPVVAVVTHGHFDHVGGLHEFGDRRAHAADADMTRSPFPLRLRREDFPEGTEAMYAYYGFPVPDVAVHAVPEPGFDVAGWVAPGAEPTSLLTDGDVIDLGDRRLEVLHTPGHTPGSICLWEAATGTLFTGDACYVDARLSFEDPPAAAKSLARLAELPVRVAHTGHDRSVGGDELRAVAAETIAAIAAGAYDDPHP